MVRFSVFFLMAVVIFGMIASDPKDGMVALLTVAVLSGIGLIVFRRHTDEKSFITYAFLGALCARLIFGILVHSFEMREFVGPDSLGYDMIGSKIVDYWLGYIPQDWELESMMSLRGSGWGMNYLVGFIYLVTGKSIFIAQSFCAVIGAATIPLVYFCSIHIFNNKRLAKSAAVAVAFFPPFIIWSSQLLKDGLIVFLLVLTMTMVLQIQKRFSVSALLLLIFSLFGILSLRFYIFYMVGLAVVGGFLVTAKTSLTTIIQRTTILVVIGFTLAYLGVIGSASLDLQQYGNLEKIQISRSDLASRSSGYGGDIDVSTVGGAFSVLPIGFAYLMFAPFPWEISNLRQSLTLPDMIIWWALMPFLVYGLWYSVKNRLSANFPILIFTLLLTFSYSLYQGNLGAAYRQRTQLQVFLFMFIAVGWELVRERIEERKLIEANRKEEYARKMRAHLQQSQ